MEINRRETILVLSKILGYVGIDDTYHGHRVGYIVWRLSEHLKLPDDQRTELAEAGLLHDIGVSSTVAHQMLVSRLDVPNAIEHCLVGESIITSIPTFSHLAPLIRYHHEHWKRFDFKKIHPTIALYSNLIFLADRLDVLMSHHEEQNESVRESILDALVNLQDLLFAPQCIEALLAEVEHPSFWEMLEKKEQIATHLQQEMAGEAERNIDFAGLEGIATTFSHIIDAKSPFTHEHSQNTARVAALLSEKFGCHHHVTDKLRVAAMFHDIGKLRVPDEILEKPGRLDEEERRIIEQHPEDSWKILCKMRGLEDVASWTRMHHEKLNGKGYPRGLRGDEIAPEAQILAVADIFQSLLQKRPYRIKMEMDQVYAIMDKMVDEGEINAHLVSLIKDHQEEFLVAAAA